MKKLNRFKEMLDSLLKIPKDDIRERVIQASLLLEFVLKTLTAEVGERETVKTVLKIA